MDPPARPPTGLPLPLHPRYAGLERLRTLLQDGDWRGLEAALDVPWVWVWDRPLRPAELVAGLESVLGDAVDVRLLLLAPVTERTAGGSLRATVAACLMWGEVGGWREHELELRLHVAFAPGPPGAAGRLLHLGVTEVPAGAPAGRRVKRRRPDASAAPAESRPPALPDGWRPPALVALRPRRGGGPSGTPTARRRCAADGG